MTSMDINAVATKTVKNFLTYENSFAQIQKDSIIMPHYFWYITGRKKYTKNDTWQTKNMESASNTDCSILCLSMQWCVILFLEICCTIWSKKNVVLLKRQWNIITERFFWKGSREDNVKAGKKPHTTWLLGFGFCHYGLCCAEDNLLHFFPLHDFLKTQGVK